MESVEILHRDAPGPMGSACMEIRLAGERFAAERAAAGGGTASLLRRSDEILAALEELNLRRVRLVPESGVSQLAALMADLPFAYRWRLGGRMTPSHAIDMVFDIQDGLLRAIRGAQPEDDVVLEMAS
ncbi:MAG TPA: hypothetical protein VGQ42_05365 [Candidatus Dormibacteraeota bacterium]|jgi:hypothetical protein|nr:hypothetical protein [Candidatus Dormibacteraeota bacterium]